MLLPIALDVEGRRILVVGGGNVAARKVASLLECGALVVVVSPTLVADFPQPVEHLARPFGKGDCTGFSLVFAATDQREVNASVAHEARAQDIWCNIADAPQTSDFHTTSVVRRGEITIGISTQGVSPVLAKHIREQAEAAVGEEYAALLNIASELSIPTSKRGEFWRQVLASEALELLRQSRRDEARQILVSFLNHIPSN